jgi:hypothetical protein
MESVKPPAHPRLPISHLTRGDGDVSVYALVDVRTREVGYVGSTSRPDMRYADHISGTLRQGHQTFLWCQSRKVALVTLEWTSKRRANAVKRRWHGTFSKYGRLLNDTAPGPASGAFYDEHGRHRRVGWLKKAIKKRAGRVRSYRSFRRLIDSPG